MKGLNAFMNTNGGSQYWGVDDKGIIRGLLNPNYDGIMLQVGDILHAMRPMVFLLNHMSRVDGG